MASCYNVSNDFGALFEPGRTLPVLGFKKYILVGAGFLRWRLAWVLCNLTDGSPPSNKYVVCLYVSRSFPPAHPNIDQPVSTYLASMYVSITRKCTGATFHPPNAMPCYAAQL